MPEAILSPSETAQYQDKGFVIPRFSLPAEMVKDLQDTLDELIRANPDVRPEKLVSAHIEGKQQGKNGDGVAGSKKFLQLALYPPLVEMVSQVIGPDVALWGCQVFCKPAEHGFT